MAWSKTTTETSWHTKCRKSRRVMTHRYQAKTCVYKTVPPQPNFSQQELIRVQCFMSGYKLTDKTVGSGAYAKVYLAEVNPDKMITDPIKGTVPLQEIATQVAIKVIDKSMVPVGFLKKFLPRELENHSVLSIHPNIVRCFEYFTSGDHVFIVLEYCKNGDLLDLINTSISQHGQCFSRELMKKIFRQICFGVQHLHKERIVHRDLKCENILLTKENNAKITDFGFSCRVQNEDTVLNTSCGSYAYAAPEVIRCKPYLGFKADIWSLGIILFAMANGRLPFKDGLVTDVDEQMREQTLTFGNTVPAECIVLLRRILQYDPENRLTLDEILNDRWLCEKQTRAPVQRLVHRPKWVNSYTIEKDVREMDLQTGVQTTSLSRDAYDTSAIYKQPVKTVPSAADPDPVARPATWPRRPVLKARATRDGSRPASSMMIAYLSVADERQRLSRTKARLRVPVTLENNQRLPDWYFHKLKKTNGKLKTIDTTPELNVEILTGVRSNRTVHLQRERKKRALDVLTNIYAKSQRDGSLSKPRKKGCSLSDAMKSKNAIPSVQSLCVSPNACYMSPRTALPNPPTPKKSSPRNPVYTRSCMGRIIDPKPNKVTPSQIVLVTPIIKPALRQGREHGDENSLPSDRSSSSTGCGYSQTRSSYLRCQASKAKVNYQKSGGRAVQTPKPTCGAARTKI